MSTFNPFPPVHFRPSDAGAGRSLLEEEGDGSLPAESAPAPPLAPGLLALLELLAASERFNLAGLKALVEANVHESYLDASSACQVCLMGLEGRRERGRVRVRKAGRVRERGPQSRPCLAESRTRTENANNGTRNGRPHNTGRGPTDTTDTTHKEGGAEGPTLTQSNKVLTLAFTRYGFTSRLMCTNQLSCYCPPHSHCPHGCNTIAILLRNTRPLSDPRFYAIQHTILCIAIWYKG